MEPGWKLAQISTTTTMIDLEKSSNVNKTTQRQHMPYAAEPV